MLSLVLAVLLAGCGVSPQGDATEAGGEPARDEADPPPSAPDAAATTTPATPDDPVREPLPSPEEIAALPPDGGPEFNRLVFEASPYLRQHARNPVDWHPWGDEAFALARELDRPIFLSVGYATCHWCHVMEHESFEDEDVAALMNATFVCVKVDREERPDLDHVYMQVTQAMTGRGGWPMTVLLTPDGEPFFAATYIPRTGRGGRPGMMELVPRIATAWRTNREGILGDAERVTTWLRDNAGGAPGDDLGPDVLAAAAAELAARFDETYKGFGQAPKFPVPHDLSLLLRWSQRSGDAEALRRATETLRAMRAGGIYDQVGFGFHRYSTDARWFLPHFEKMLYDQALHVLAYTGAWQVTGEEEYRRTAEEVLAYVLRDLRDPAGGFYSAEDADSEGEEGLFYTWTWDELQALLTEDELAVVAAAFGARPEGNYHDEATRAPTGRNHFARVRAPEDVAAELGLSAADAARRLESARAKLLERRSTRVRPFLDDKVLTDWNGLMLAALARAGAAFDDARYLDAARGAADFVLRELRDEGGRLHKRWRAGEAGLPATLEDHAFLAWGLLELYKADHDLRWLREARQVVDTMVAHFHDGEDDADGTGGFFLTADDAPRLLVRAKESYDGALPSGNSAAAYALVQLARLTGETHYEELAAGTLRAFAAGVRRMPSAHALMLQALDPLAGGGVELVVAGDPADPRTQALLDVVRARHLPNAVLLLHDPARTAELAELSPYAAAMGPVDGEPAAYLCRDFACEAPVTDPAAFASRLDAALRVGGAGG